MATPKEILIDYQNHIEIQENQISRLKRNLNTISLCRLSAFIVEIIVIALMINTGFSPVFLILLVLPLIAFIVLVRKQSFTQDALNYEQQLLWVYLNEKAQLLSGENGYDDGSRYADDNHPYTSDLDIFGPASLYSMLNRCNTLKGMDLLADYLQTAAGIEGILQRQEAIGELTSHLSETFRFRALLRSHKPRELQVITDKLKAQLAEQLKFADHTVLRVIVTAVPFVSLLMLIAGISLGGLVWKFLLLLGLFNAAVTLFFLRDVNRLHAGFSGSSASLNNFSGAVKWTEGIKWQSIYIRNFFDKETGINDVSLQIKRLASIIHSFDARLNIIVGGVLNIFLLWDLKHALKLADWHRQSSGPLMRGLERISKFEELISLATLRHNQPGWVFPVLKHDFQLKATALGHPLIPVEKRINNDFELGQQPTTDIITGSNMAGKSTFLRTLGINMVLAFAGAPVCAETMQLSVFNLLSYMRIKDSLNDQTSTFKAELNRLKMILDTTARQKDSFVLIDEMLRGTNSKDKYLGSKVFIEKLISQQTSALFATHDLQLSEMESIHPMQVRNYHFDIQIALGEMQFDYKLKPGACKTFNAVLLLREIGLTLS